MTTKALKDFDAYITKAGLDPKPHQREAVAWTLEREFALDAPCGVRGGLIADEMGLGKTIVMMGTIVANFVPRTLIVLPLALLAQWRSEIQRTMGHDPLVFHGENKALISNEMLAKAPIVLTTYGHVKIGKGKGATTRLHSIPWNRVICDEAHHLRNSRTRGFAGVVALKAEIRWLITGTPIQNRIRDFFALCACMGLPEEFYSKQENLTTIGKTFLLKRTKAEVGIQLPPLKDHEIVVPWNNEDEHKLAQDIHSLLHFSNVSPKHGDSLIASLDHGMLALLVRARQSCVYPQLIAEQLQKFVEINSLQDPKAFERATSCSSKLDAVQAHIAERKHNGRSKIVFCHYRGEIDELKTRLSDVEKMHVEVMDGRTSADQRARITGDSPDVLILQVQTGCEGLNLQQFSEIYFVSPNWNPAIEDQAVARAHRIGQDHQVDVYRFIMEGFDEDMEDTQTLDLYSQGVQTTKRRAMRFVDGEIGEKDDEDDEDELKNVDKRYKTRDGYLRDGFTV